MPLPDIVRAIAPPEVVAAGISQAFRSEQTPPFPEMVAHLFGQSDPNQKAESLNQLLRGIGSSAGLPAQGGLTGLAGGSVTPQQANQAPPEQVRQAGGTRASKNPSIVDEVSSFCSRHPDVVKALGGLAATIALQHMLQRR